MATNQRAAIYVRISSDASDKQEGVTRQREDCLARAHREGWEVVRVFEDNDISASTRSKKPRPNYDEMLKAAREGQFEVILAYANSRLTRRRRELEDLIDLHKECKAAGHEIKFCTIVSGDDDLGTSDGRTVARIKGDVDAAESERTSERRLREARAKREAGMHQGRRPFGWSGHAPDKYGRPKLVADRLHPVEGPALRAAVRAILGGYSLAQVCRRWNARGLRTASGNSWTLTNLRLVLCRWRNAGVVEYKGKPMEVAASWPAVCTRKQLEELRRKLIDPERRRMGGSASTTLLASLARCGKCERPLVSGSQRLSRRDTSKVRTYRCSGALAHQNDKCYVTINSVTLDEMVVQKIKEVLWFGNHRSIVPTPEDRLALERLTNERRQNVEEEAQIGLLLAKRIMSLVSAEPALKALTERRDLIDANLEAIASQCALSSLVLGAPVVVRGQDGVQRASFDRAAEIAKDFDTLELSKRRTVVRGLLTVTVHPGRNADERVVMVLR